MLLPQLPQMDDQWQLDGGCHAWTQPITQANMDGSVYLLAGMRMLGIFNDKG